jgi:hypothetical protein
VLALPKPVASGIDAANMPIPIVRVMFAFIAVLLPCIALYTQTP